MVGDICQPPAELGLYYVCGNVLTRKGRKCCRKCESRLRRKRHKVKSAYESLRTHAKERRIEFTVTYDYWQEFCALTNYHERRGTGKDDLSIDRKICTIGYTDHTY